MGVSLLPDKSPQAQGDRVGNIQKLRIGIVLLGSGTQLVTWDVSNLKQNMHNKQQYTQEFSSISTFYETTLNL